MTYRFSFLTAASRSPALALQALTNTYGQLINAACVRAAQTAVNPAHFLYNEAGESSLQEVQAAPCFLDTRASPQGPEVNNAQSIKPGDVLLDFRGKI